MNLKTALFSLALFALAFTSACEGDRARQHRDSKDSVAKMLSAQADPALYLSLKSFESCSVADAYVRDNLRLTVKKRFDEQREQLIHWQDGRWGGRLESVADSAAPSGNEGAADAPTDFSKTNTQVAGVDEPDMMKTNGTHIFTISGQKIQIVQSWPANEMKRLKTLKVDGSPRNLFLTEDQKLVVASHPRIERQIPQKSYDSPWGYYASYDSGVVRLEVYDVSDVAAPVLTKTFHFRGNYLDMRRQGQIIRLVSSSAYPSFPEGLETYIDWYAGDRRMSLQEFDLTRAILEQRNEAILSKLTLSSFLAAQNHYAHRSGWDGTSDDLLDKEGADCSQVYATAAIKEFGLTTVTSLDLGDSSLSQAALLAPANTIYASHESLYLAFSYRGWWWGRDVEDGAKLFIHKFAYESPATTKVSYQGSGVLDGYLHNQFSLDEHEGHLRVALTDDRIPVPSPSQREWPEFTTVNRVVVMKPIDGKLEAVGKTQDLAPGERIYSARFNGKKGYVVTFRQTDPLYTLDLSDPTNPTVTGELKINGYSSYIHMIDENTLLAVGQDADPNTGRPLGLKISVFDVSDPAAPKEAFTKLLSDDSSYAGSEAEYDHHAFTYFASRGLLGIPVGGYRKSDSEYWWNDYFSELRVFKIDLKQGISDVGAIAMNDLYQGKRLEWSHWWGGSQVRRSVFADDMIYAISSAGIKAVHGDDLTAPVSSVSFYP